MSNSEKDIIGDGSGGSTLVEPVAIRVSPHSYFTSLLLSSFISAFLFYIERDVFGVVVFALSWIVLPFLALNDKIVFDGRRLVRTGLVPATWARLNGSRRSLRLRDIEQVETEAIRAAKRGGNVFYRYRVMIRGKGLAVTIASGGKEFREMVRSILPQLPENVLDTRSIELRDHLSDPRMVLERAESEHIPSADFLENSLRTSLRDRGRHRLESQHDAGSDERVDELRDLANQLRVSGFFLQALEAFRRALLLRPKDAHLLFEFARCLHSFAGVQRDPRMERRALAALRLSERRAQADDDMLVRLGEWYFQIGEWRRAGNVFQSAIERLGDNFRTARGLAEIALREGKIAHVIHHFSTANRVAETPSLRRWSKGEAEYFSNLNSDEEYMELEIGRVNLLETVETSKKTTLRITFLALPTIIFGVLFEDNLIANIGWAVSGVALAIWTGLIVTQKMLAQRIPYDLVESED